MTAPTQLKEPTTPERLAADLFALSKAAYTLHTAIAEAELEEVDVLAAQAALEPLLEAATDASFD